MLTAPVAKGVVTIDPPGPMGLTPGAKCITLVATSTAGGAISWTKVLGPGTITAAAAPSPSARFCIAVGDTGQARVTASVGPESATAIIDVAPMGGLFQRLLVGAEGAGGAATQPTPRLFVNMMLTTPVGAGGGELGPRTRVWIDSRISSSPRQFDIKVSDFIAGGLPTAVKNLKVNEIAQVIDLLGGVQFRLLGENPAPRKMFFDSRKSATTVSLIAAYGGTTPLIPKDFISAYRFPVNGSDANARLRRQFGDQINRTPAATVVAFVPEDRSRFWRQYYGGIRLQSHFYEANDAISAIPMRTPYGMFRTTQLSAFSERRRGLRRAGIPLRAMPWC